MIRELLQKTSTRSPSAGQASAGRPGTKSGHVQHNQAPEKEKPGKPDPNGPRARRASELNTSNDSPVRERRPDATEVNPEQAPSPCGHVTEQDAAAAGATPAEVGLKPSPAADGVPLEAVDARVDSWRSARDPLETGSGRVCESGLKKGFVTGPEKGFETGLERGWEEGLAGGSETGLAGGLETGVNRSSAGGSDTGLAGVLKTSAETGLDAGLETGLAEGLGTGLAENSKTGVKTQLVGGSETGLAGSLKTGAGTGLAGGSETGLAGGLKTGVEGGLKTGLETGSAEDVKRGVETNPETGSRAAEGRPVFVVVNSNSSEIQERGPLREAIAGLQREGVAQVVERAMTLPVDLVIHGGTCVRLLTPERLGLRNPFQAGDPSTVSTKHVVDWLRRVSLAFTSAILLSYIDCQESGRMCLE